MIRRKALDWKLFLQLPVDDYHKKEKCSIPFVLVNQKKKLWPFRTVSPRYRQLYCTLSISKVAASTAVFYLHTVFVALATYILVFKYIFQQYITEPVSNISVSVHLIKYTNFYLLCSTSTQILNNCLEILSFCPAGWLHLSFLPAIQQLSLLNKSTWLWHSYLCDNQSVVQGLLVCLG